jgi:hypothetical protein
MRIRFERKWEDMWIGWFWGVMETDSIYGSVSFPASRFTSRRRPRNE